MKKIFVMSSKTNSIIKNGAIICVPMILLSVVSYVFTIEESKLFGWLTVLVFIATIYFVQRFYRTEVYDGSASYGQLLGGTMLMLLIASGIMLIFTFIFYKFIAPEQIDRILVLAEDNLYDKGLSDKEIEQSMVYISKFNSPVGLSIMALLSTIFQGFIFALIVSLFNKKKKDAFAEVMKEVADNEEE